MNKQTKEVIINKPEILKYIIKKSLSEDVNIRGRLRLLIEARFIYFYILRNTEKMVYQKIGDTVGMNHASVLHGSIKAGHWIDLDYKFKDKYLTILATYSREVYGAKAEGDILKRKQPIKPPEEYIQVEGKKPMKRIATVYAKLHTLIDKTPENKVDDLLVRVEAIYNMMQSDLKRKRI